VYLGDGDEAVWVDFIEAFEDAGFAHAWVDKDADGAGAEYCEGECDEFDGWSHHEHESMSGLDTGMYESFGGGINICVKLLEGDGRPCGASAVIAGVGGCDGVLRGYELCGVSKAICDIESGGHVDFRG
jgi:hypothetical protein